MAVGTPDNLLWGAAGDEGTSFLSSLWSQVNDVIGILNNLHVVFNDDQRMSALDECVEGFEKDMDVMEMQSCSRFVKNKECGLRLFGGQVISQFHPLILAS